MDEVSLHVTLCLFYFLNKVPYKTPSLHPGTNDNDVKIAEKSFVGLCSLVVLPHDHEVEDELPVPEQVLGVVVLPEQVRHHVEVVLGGGVPTKKRGGKYDFKTGKIAKGALTPQIEKRKKSCQEYTCTILLKSVEMSFISNDEDIQKK